MSTYNASNDSIRMVTEIIKNMTASSILLPEKESCKHLGNEGKGKRMPDR